MSERVLVAMSGGVDSSVAAALLVEAGHEVVGATLKLWGGESDSGCCSVADVDDARSVARRLGIEHHVFNFGDDFDEHVVAPYVADHAAGRTPNPCIECNRHLKFDRLLRRADALGFDAVATGHHARIVGAPRRHPPRGPRRRPGQGPVLRRARPRPRGARARALPGRRPHQGRGARRGRPPRPAPPRTSPTARTSASSPPPAGGRRSSGTASPPTPGSGGRRRGADGGRGRRGRARHARPAAGPRAARWRCASVRGRRRRRRRHRHRRLGGRPARRRGRARRPWSGSAHPSAGPLARPGAAPTATARRAGSRGRRSCSTSRPARVAPGQSVVLYDGDDGGGGRHRRVGRLADAGCGGPRAAARSAPGRVGVNSSRPPARAAPSCRAPAGCTSTRLGEARARGPARGLAG